VLITLELHGPDLGGCSIAVSGDQPSLIVAVGEVLEGDPEVLDGFEAAHPEQVFLECADEAFGDAVALGLADKGGEVRIPTKVISC